MSTITPIDRSVAHHPASRATGPSSACRNGEHSRCVELGMECKCECPRGSGGHGPETQHAPVAVKWEEPPMRGSRRHLAGDPFDARWVATVKAEPGRWARWEPDFRGTAATYWSHMIRTGSTAKRDSKAFKEAKPLWGPGWEARTTTVLGNNNTTPPTPNKSRLFVRYVGEKPTKA